MPTVTLTIDPEFAARCRQLKPREKSLLESSISQYGCLEPITVWANHEDTILDGHSRYEICQSLKVPYKTRALAFDDRAACLAWIDNNQEARRNESDTEREYRRGKQYNELKHQGERTDITSAQSEQKSPNTAEAIGLSEGVGQATIRRNAKFAEAVDKIAANVGDDFKQDILTGALKAKTKDILAIAAMPKKQQREAVKALRDGERPTELRIAPVVVDGEAETSKDLAGIAKRFGCIYADPPWSYGNQATRAATGNHYRTMTLEELCAMPVGELAAPNAQLHLWTTSSFLFDAKRVIDAWGFEYRSSFVWVKPQMGIGNYWRLSHEFLLTAIRGNAKHFNNRGLKSWGEFPRNKHSAKPEEIRGLIEQASDGPYLELFGRKEVAGWTVYGNQVEQRLFA